MASDAAGRKGRRDNSGRLDASLAHPAPQVVGVDPGGQRNTRDRSAGLAAGFEQGLLERFGVDATGTA